LPDISDKIKTVKTNINNGNYAEAEKILPKALMVKSYRPQLSYPLPLCDLKVTMPIEKMVKEYYRSVNMDNGEVTVSFKDKNTRFERNLFVSRVNDLICYQISKSGQKTIDCNFKFDLHDKFNNRGPGGITQVNDDFEFAASKGYMTYSARSDNGTDYGVVARVINVGGSVTCGEDGIEVKGADKVTLFAKVYIDSQKDREEESIKKELSMIKLTYEKLLKEHASFHSKLMNIGSLSLNAKQESYVDELIDKTVNGELPTALLERLYKYYERREKIEEAGLDPDDYDF
jgi:alpha-L-fucosidase 2